MNIIVCPTEKYMKQEVHGVYPVAWWSLGLLLKASWLEEGKSRIVQEDRSQAFIEYLLCAKQAL
jgi:hypothetical protein